MTGEEQEHPRVGDVYLWINRDLIGAGLFLVVATNGTAKWERDAVLFKEFFDGEWQDDRCDFWVGLEHLHEELAKGKNRFHPGGWYFRVRENP